MTKWLTTSLLIVLGLQGCASVPEPEATAEEPKTASGRESRMQELWAGRDYSELIAEMGKPVFELDIPRYGWPNSRALLYGLDQESGCIDAFLIVKGDERTWVESYFCR